MDWAKLTINVSIGWLSEKLKQSIVIFEILIFLLTD